MGEADKMGSKNVGKGCGVEREVGGAGDIRSYLFRVQSVSEKLADVAYNQA